MFCQVLENKGKSPRTVYTVRSGCRFTVSSRRHPIHRSQLRSLAMGVSPPCFLPGHRKQREKSKDCAGVGQDLHRALIGDAVSLTESALVSKAPQFLQSFFSHSLDRSNPTQGEPCRLRKPSEAMVAGWVRFGKGIHGSIGWPGGALSPLFGKGWASAYGIASQDSAKLSRVDI